MCRTAMCATGHLGIAAGSGYAAGDASRQNVVLAQQTPSQQFAWAGNAVASAHSRDANIALQTLCSGICACHKGREITAK